MTKLEEKLIELGYELEVIKDEWANIYIYHFEKYIKYYNNSLVIQLSEEKKIISFYVVNSGLFDDTTDINNLQQAFNQLQNDLEVLKQDESS